MAKSKNIKKVVSQKMIVESKNGKKSSFIDIFSALKGNDTRMVRHLRKDNKKSTVFVKSNSNKGYNVTVSNQNGKVKKMKVSSPSLIKRLLKNQRMEINTEQKKSKKNSKNMKMNVNNGNGNINNGNGNVNNVNGNVNGNNNNKTLMLKNKKPVRKSRKNRYPKKDLQKDGFKSKGRRGRSRRQSKRKPRHFKRRGKK